MDEFEIGLVEEGAPVYNIRHRCFHFSKALIHFIQKQKPQPLFSSLYSQLVRSGTSIGANVVEGSAGSSTKDFVNFQRIALKSANETKYWLCLIRDTQNPTDTAQIAELIREADELSKIIATIILNTLKK